MVLVTMNMTMRKKSNTDKEWMKEDRIDDNDEAEKNEDINEEQ